MSLKQTLVGVALVFVAQVAWGFAMFLAGYYFGTNVQLFLLVLVIVVSIASLAWGERRG